MTNPTQFHFVNNEFIDSTSKDTYDVFNPATDELLGTITLAREQEVDAAVRAARAAFDAGEWSTYTGAQRAACMLKFASLLENEENAAEISKAETQAMGQPISLMRGAIIPMCAGIWRYYAGFADKIAGETFPVEGGFYRMTTYEPLGVCAGIGPWNVTLIIMSWKMAPALAAGNTFIFKASEKSPYSVLRLARLFKDAGFPPGVVNFVTGDGTTGSLLASHMQIDKIAFTGSGAAGRKVVDAANKSNMKKVSLELGGKSPTLVFPDADIENALKGNSQGFLFNSGQICFAASRLFVHSSIATKFIDGLKEAFAAAEGLMGDPSEPTTTLGPLADKSQLQRVMGYIESGKSEATLVVGGKQKPGKGAFVQPTIFLNPGKDAKICQEEIFGPVLTVQTFETEEEAIKLANDSSYGLSACIYTASTSRGLRVASKLKVGTVAINSSYMPDNNTPFGGYKQSGGGRELGKEGLMAYLQSKTIKINMGI